VTVLFSIIFSFFLFTLRTIYAKRETHADTANFLHPLRRLSPPVPANSPAKPAGSNTLPQAGYAHSCSEN